MSAINDPIADFLTRLRNARASSAEKVSIPYSKLKGEIARILKQEGYINNYEVDTSGNHPELVIQLKEVHKTPAITGLKRISKPGLRKYVGSRDVPRVLGGLGIAILSTSSGVMTDREARKQKVGGELLAYIW